MRPQSTGFRLETPQARTHLSSVHAVIRHRISRGTIRVGHASGGGTWIVLTTDERSFHAIKPPEPCPRLVGHFTGRASGLSKGEHNEIQ
jgi:hypothetical protein